MAWAHLRGAGGGQSVGNEGVQGRRLHWRGTASLPMPGGICVSKAFSSWSWYQGNAIVFYIPQLSSEGIAVNTHTSPVSLSDVGEHESAVAPGTSPHRGMSRRNTTQTDVSVLYPPGTLQGRGTL